MGICGSIENREEINDDSYGQESVVYYTGIITNQSQQIGSAYSHTGSKGLNQDCAIIYKGYGVEDGILCAVFDGHGENGHIVSNIVRNKLPNRLLSHMNLGKTILPPLYSSKNDKLESGQFGSTNNFLKWKKACLSSFKVVDKQMKCIASLDTSCSGTTAAVVIKQGDNLVIANLGDSRVVLGTRTEMGTEIIVALTTDLKPGVSSEAERIRKCKGRVLALREEPHIQRVWLPHSDSPGLAMSRAFGDFVLKKNGIICTPEVTYHRLSPNDMFLVVASDGVWDVLSNEQVMSIVTSASSEEEAARAVVDAAVGSWEHKFPNSDRDDCTVICLFLQK